LAELLRDYGDVQCRPSDPSTWRAEVLFGRTLAACIHPIAAWRYDIRSFRVLLLAGYFTAGFIAVLLAVVLMD
jgi:hypothetical protein